MIQYSNQRLRFKPVTQDDYLQVSELFSNEQVMRYALIDCLQTDAERLVFFTQIMQQKTATGLQWIAFSVFENTAEQLFVGLADFELTPYGEMGGLAEIGYFISPEHWGKGYASEICQMLFGICFQQYHAHKVYAACNAENKASEKVMIKAGMQKEAELRQHRLKNGNWHNELRYSILESEFKSQYPIS